MMAIRFFCCLWITRSPARISSRKRGFHCSSTTLLQALANKDVSKLPRLYVGNAEPTVRYIPNLSQLSSETTTNNVPPPRLVPDATIVLNADQSHHLTNVLRIFKKQSAQQPQVRLFDGHSEHLASVSFVGTKRAPLVSAVCLQCLRATTNAPHNTKQRAYLIVAPPKKKDRFKWLIEKATELNVSGFLFVSCDHSQASPFDHHHSKLHAYMVEASEQCERLTIPQVVSLAVPNKAALVSELSHVLQQDCWQEDAASSRLLICRERSPTTTKSILDALFTPTKTVNTFFLIGPEGGWSTAEMDQLDALQQRCGATNPVVENVSLGETVLRVETACLAALAAFGLLRNQPTTT